MNRIAYCLIATIVMASQVVIHGCVTPGKVSVKIKNSLPEGQLAYYNDSFNKLRDDLWDRAGYVSEDIQLENIKLADVIIDDGKLVIKTKTGSYSKGGLASRYALKGDFDIQIDCQFDFIREKLRMDQLSNFAIIDKKSHYEAFNLVVIGLSKRGEMNSYIYTGCRKSGEYEGSGAEDIGSFRGSLRITRSGSEVGTYYKEAGEAVWHGLGTMSFNANDVMIGLMAANFVADRKDLTASESFTVAFDNFRINSAQAIIEEEI